ncbi:MAG: hypothetical protein HS129_15080 [Leptospiraceae bacterium]|nr:hypothetical protein [Leptospiraceae bacterium]
MLNPLVDLKELVSVKPYVLDMDDSRPLSDGKTIWERFLDSSAERAKDQIIEWGFTYPESNPTSQFLSAEVLLVKADIVEEFGFQESLDAEQIQVGGQGGESRRYKKFSVEERGEKAKVFRDKAYKTLAGKNASVYPGVE